MLNIFFKELFYVLTGGLIVFSILELVWPRIVISYISLNLVLLAWLIIGIVILSLNRSEKQKNG
ncbi:MAG: hypothetical protein ABIG60_01500 [Patescibacteria group bacterium]